MSSQKQNKTAVFGNSYPVKVENGIIIGAPMPEIENPMTAERFREIDALAQEEMKALLKARK